MIVDRDLELRNALVVDGDLVVNGWITIERHGRLACSGTVACLGMTIEPGGALECGELHTNFFAVDNSKSDTRVTARWIRARLVDLVQRALEDVIARGDVRAEYTQHWGGDLNPSWDYARGKLGLLPELYEAQDDEGDKPVIFDVAAIRAALAADEPVFRKPGPLLGLAPQAKSAPPAELAPTELEAFIAAHPGPQRALLEALRADWLPRLSTADAGEQARAARSIRRALKSPKLARDVDALVAGLATVVHVVAPTASVTDRLVRSTVRGDFARLTPDAWLSPFPVDSETISVAHDPQIVALPARIGEYTRVVNLSVCGTRISRVPAEIGRLQRLEHLDLQQNRLASLPVEIGRLAALKTLNVEWNHELTALPDSVCDLAELEQLSIGHTQIRALPRDFGRLAKLSYVNLHDCAGIDLPESFFTLPSLSSLYLHGTQLPSAVLARIRATFPSCNFWRFFI